MVPAQPAHSSFPQNVGLGLSVLLVLPQMYHGRARLLYPSGPLHFICSSRQLRWMLVKFKAQHSSTKRRLVDDIAAVAPAGCLHNGLCGTTSEDGDEGGGGAR